MELQQRQLPRSDLAATMTAPHTAIRRLEIMLIVLVVLVSMLQVAVGVCIGLLLP